MVHEENILSIITIGGIKGGTGKTTLATNLAIIRNLEEKEVLLIDGDEQGSSTDFSSVRAEVRGSTGYTSIQLTGSAIRTQGLLLASKYQDIIIDAGGRDTSSQRAALIISNIVLIPFNPRSFDIWTLGKVVKLIDECKSVNPELKAFVFLNKADATGNDNCEAAEALKEVKIFNYLNTAIGLRKAFANAASNGASVVEQKPADKKAVDEIQALYRCLYDV
jgi:chromosome partitioning protein